MTINDIQRAFKESACGELDIATGGMNRYVVHVPFTFTDGDHYVVLLKQEGKRWLLSDEAHTFMHLSYDLTDAEFDQGNRRKIIDGVLNNHGIEDRSGELVLPIPEGRYGDALFSFVQAITRIADVIYLNRERVRSTFFEDFRRLVEEKAEAVGMQDVQFNYTHPTHDPEHHYPVTARLNGRTTQQLLIFGISNDEQCRDATITLHQWEKWHEKFHSFGVFRDQMEINRLVLARFSDIAGRQLSSLEIARERLPQYLREVFQR
jgi:hypothetical protein